MRIFRFVSGTAAALALVAGLAAAEPAAARDRMSPGAAAAVGVLGGLAVGTVLGATVAQPAYAAPAPVYVAPPPPPPPPVVYRAPPRRAYVESETVYYSRPAPPPPVVVERCVTREHEEWVPGYGWQTRTRKTCRR
jgi:hypothetical protein